MNNKAHLLNVLLALVIVVLVYQLSTNQSSETAEQPVFTEVPLMTGDTIASEKKSLGVKGHIHPKPALVIGSYSADGKANIMTAAWAGIVSSTPMSIGVSIRPNRKSYENIMATKSFTVNVPSAQNVAHMDYAGNISGYDVDKFKVLNLTPVKGDYVNAPYIQEFPIVIECEVTDMFELGSHIQFIGKIIDTKVDEQYLDEDDNVDIERINPVIYGGEYYYGFGQRLAKPWDVYKLFIDDMAPSYQPIQYTNSTLASIYNRKSVRHYTNRQVSKDQLTELVKAGMAAPTAVDKRPWAFIAISERSVLDSLAEVLPYAQMLKQATAAIVVCGDMDKALEGIAQAYWIQDCSAASQNILLAAESMGLGAVWTGVHPIEEREQVVKTVLNAPDNVVPLNVIAVGYPTGEEMPKNKWNEDNVHWDGW
ncbi:nitroreductase family protein [Carboxylicivirga mesophila]|uniref:Nitroreductase family protein n=1 Tax=Carboxylicivirga mesophila TaxID=1166478 RepID=A0ABS5K523_9BACT|nr:flavin reductase [Carboxylicivirga mesophila]MBS2210097.1 nitroreductase family protein [Carboxylicivirga mesophila]